MSGSAVGGSAGAPAAAPADPEAPGTSTGVELVPEIDFGALAEGLHALATSARPKTALRVLLRKARAFEHAESSRGKRGVGGE
jgi:hypothetical protein